MKKSPCGSWLDFDVFQGGSWAIKEIKHNRELNQVSGKHKKQKTKKNLEDSDWKGSNKLCNYTKETLL